MAWILADPHWLTNRLARHGLAERLRLHLAVFGISLVWLGLVFFASCLDRTRTLPGIGKGFLQHGGYIALHLATPVALSLSLLALDLFSKLMQKLNDFVQPGLSTISLETLRDERLSILNLKSRWTLLLLLFVATGAACTTVVLMQVIDPVATYGNDVFNACRYPFGYYTANSYLALSWTVIFPFSLFLVLSITASLVTVLNRARRDCLLRVDVLSADNCGGLAAFGDLNLLLMLYYVPPFLAMSALAATHARKYASLLIPAGGLSLTFLLQSIIGVYAIHLAIRAEKQLRLLDLHDLLDHALHHPTCTSDHELTFLLWQHVRGVNTMPYAKNVQLLIDLLRYAPPMIAVYNVLTAMRH